jgi:hypothetical protein
MSLVLVVTGEDTAGFRTRDNPEVFVVGAFVLEAAASTSLVVSSAKGLFRPVVDDLTGIPSLLEVGASTSSSVSFAKGFFRPVADVSTGIPSLPNV